MSTTAPRKNIMAKAAMFDKKEEATPVSSSEYTPKQFDRTKTAFLTQSNQSQSTSSNKVADEINQLKSAHAASARNQVHVSMIC